MNENSPAGTTYIYHKSGNCCNCNAEIEVSDTEIFNKKFMCPICGAENKIELSRSARSLPVSNDTSIVEGREGACFHCKVGVEVSDDELTNGKFICPDCGAENIIEIKNAGLRKWIPLIPIALILITFYLFGGISNLLTFKKNMVETSNNFKSYFIDGIVGLEIIIWIVTAYIIYAYYKKRHSLKLLVLTYFLIIIAASLISTFLLYYPIYILYDRSSIISSGGADWESINNAIKYTGEEKLFTIKETIINSLFLFGLLLGAEKFFTSLGSKE